MTMEHKNAYFRDINVIGFTFDEIRIKIEQIAHDYFNKEANIFVIVLWF
jgi:hypothetical protein